MKEIKTVRWRPKAAAPTADFGWEQARRARAFHSSFPEYSCTPLVRLQNLARTLGVRDIFVKDESKRFGLNAFKVLGGSYAIGWEIAKRLDLPMEEMTYDVLTSPQVKEKLGQLTFVTATDGNHGRGVAWTAQKLGQRAVVYMPKGSAQERLQNIRSLGAEAEIIDVNYDDAVRLARRYAENYGGIVVQDTSWEGYEEIPLHIMQGYTTMACEIAEQLAALGDVRPTHVFLQAGVGAMAGAVTGFLADYYKDDLPEIIIVEPLNAACLHKTAQTADGALHTVGGDLQSIMAGLCCGEPCSLGWRQLAAHADVFAAVPDEVAALGMRVLGNPVSGDAPVISGESGAAGLGLAAAALRERELSWLKRQLALDGDAVILCISTEGATDLANYRSIMWEGAWSWNK